MKPIRSLGIATAFVFLAGCSSVRLPFFDKAPAAAPAVAQPAAPAARNPAQLTLNDGDEAIPIHTVAFRSGTSSATVERLAKRFGCTGTQGAGLITEKGPLEVYRMKCENGTTFMAQCELRQCRPMR
ncbi:MAG TPA: hypothetical protein VEC01_17610 [Noviherbaspirillum sp.]|uniref:hypothetical protein n=1 Tax=Noviherbaspirillum sp. TaxID=1926288 RepID=UPI002D2F7987|nr:hypothetical protein [Noviherbaspirillum sp.]HYD97150.1 hypothetical protein [Noviherbaspirillum sp.]